MFLYQCSGSCMYKPLHAISLLYSFPVFSVPVSWSHYYNFLFPPYILIRHTLRVSPTLNFAMTCFTVNLSFSFTSVTSTVVFRSSTNLCFDTTATTKWTSKIFKSFTRNGMIVLLPGSVNMLLWLPEWPLFGVHITKVWNHPVCPCLWPMSPTLKWHSVICE